MTDTCGATTSAGGECELPAGWGTEYDDGQCKYHGGATRDSSGAPEGNDNAAKAGAWADDFYEDFLTQEEQRRVNEAVDVLGSQAGAQEVGRHVAALALEQFKRTGDERFLRRFESVCDKFGIAPADEMEVDLDAEHSFDATEGVTAEFVTYEVKDDGGE